MENQTVTHIKQNGRYKVVFERSATKGVIGYKVESNGDDLDETLLDAVNLKQLAELHAPEVKEG